MGWMAALTLLVVILGFVCVVRASIQLDKTKDKSCDFTQNEVVLLATALAVCNICTVIVGVSWCIYFAIN